MMTCLVCGREGTEPLKAVKLKFEDDAIECRTHITWEHAPSPGASCSPACASLIFARPTANDKELEAWRWRQRRAEARGERFDEARPADLEEREWRLLRARLERMTDDGVEAA